MFTPQLVPVSGLELAQVVATAGVSGLPSFTIRLDPSGPAGRPVLHGRACPLVDAVLPEQQLTFADAPARTEVCVACVTGTAYNYLVALRGLAFELEVLGSPLPDDLDTLGFVALESAFLVRTPWFSVENTPLLVPVSRPFGPRAASRFREVLRVLDTPSVFERFRASMGVPVASGAPVAAFFRVDTVDTYNLERPWAPFLAANQLTIRPTDTGHVLAGVLDFPLADALYASQFESFNRPYVVELVEVDGFPFESLTPEVFDTALALWDPADDVFDTPSACLYAALKL